MNRCGRHACLPAYRIACVLVGLQACAFGGSASAQAVDGPFDERPDIVFVGPAMPSTNGLRKFLEYWTATVKDAAEKAIRKKVLLHQPLRDASIEGLETAMKAPDFEEALSNAKAGKVVQWPDGGGMIGLGLGDLDIAVKHLRATHVNASWKKSLEAHVVSIDDLMRASVTSLADQDQILQRLAIQQRAYESASTEVKTRSAMVMGFGKSIHSYMDLLERIIGGGHLPFLLQAKTEAAAMIKYVAANEWWNAHEAERIVGLLLAEWSRIDAELATAIREISAEHAIRSKIRDVTRAKGEKDRRAEELQARDHDTLEAITRIDSDARANVQRQVLASQAISAHRDRARSILAGIGSYNLCPNRRSYATCTHPDLKAGFDGDVRRKKANADQEEKNASEAERQFASLRFAEHDLVLRLNALACTSEGIRRAIDENERRYSEILRLVMLSVRDTQTTTQRSIQEADLERRLRESRKATSNAAIMRDSIACFVRASRHGALDQPAPPGGERNPYVQPTLTRRRSDEPDNPYRRPEGRGTSLSNPYVRP